MIPSIFSVNTCIVTVDRVKWQDDMLGFIPVFWRYILKSFFQLFLLCVSGFISVLLVTRMKEMGRFAALASSFTPVIKFAIYQIPFILPYAIPISCLIAAMILLQRLSSSQELSALRASGLSIRKIFTPLLFGAFFLFLVNLLVCSEITPFCREKSKRLLFEKSSFHPILLLQRKNLSRLKKTYLDMQKATQKKAKGVLCVFPNHSNQRLNILYIDSLEQKKGTLLGKNVSIISHLPAQSEDGFDHLILENQEKITTDAEALSQIMKTPHWSLNPSYMPMKMLLAKIYVSSAKKEPSLSFLAELSRRFSLAFCAFTFTLLGASFGIQISRVLSKKKMLQASLMALLIMLSFALGKAMNNYPLAAVSIYILPQLSVFLITKNILRKISLGIES